MTKRKAAALALIAALAAVDQLIKAAVLLRLKPIGGITVIDRVLALSYVENTGAVFGVMSGNVTVLALVTAAALAAGLVFILVKSLKNLFEYACAVLIISGGLGNLIDRFFRGYVVDYLELLFVRFAVFNFADMLVVCGSFMLAGYLFYEIRQEKKSRSDKS